MCVETESSVNKVIGDNNGNTVFYAITNATRMTLKNSILNEISFSFFLFNAEQMGGRHFKIKNRSHRGKLINIHE